MIWHCLQHEFRFPRRPLIMGIVNVTPDSFSDGGLCLDPGRAVARGMAMVAEGADLLDIGGESTRPGAGEVGAEEEIRRVMPVIAGLAARAGVPLSIDTRKLEVAEAAIGGGASVVNDIAANRTDPALWDLVARSGVGYVAMHMRGTPETMQDRPEYGDVVAEVCGFLRDRLDGLGRRGVGPGQVALDPGIGFGKTLEHNLALIRALDLLVALGHPIVLGVSRKSFLGLLTGADVGGREPAGLACAVWAALRGVGVIRTHDVAATLQALKVVEALVPGPMGGKDH